MEKQTNTGSDIPKSAENGNSLTADRKALRERLRREGIRARDSLTPEQREQLSAAAVERLVTSDVFQRAHTVMIYEHTGGEVSLDTLKTHPLAEGKRFVYPRCISKTEMVALLPHGEESWQTGSFGIREPMTEKSDPVAPEEIDLVVCPCSAFDSECRRLGMGAGFYDRYLPGCKNAAVCAAAFEVQRASCIPADDWDIPMEFVFTEQETYKKAK